MKKMGSLLNMLLLMAVSMTVNQSVVHMHAGDRLSLH